MAIIPQKRLFTWENIEARSELDRLKMVLSVLPDEELMQDLERHRGKGRDDYPVRAIWNSVIAGIVYQHKSIESLRRELKRNGELRDLCGFDLLTGAAGVPSKDAYTHFLENLLDRVEQVEGMFHRLVQKLLEYLPDLGKYLAVDSKAIASLARGSKRKDEEALGSGKKSRGRRRRDRRRDGDADWGKKQYRGSRKDGTLWEKTVKWFGYKLHLLVDSQYELPLGFDLDKASASDVKALLPLMQDLEQRHPDVLEQSKELSADKAYDATDEIQQMYEVYGIKPVIDIRDCWKDGEATRLVNPERADNIVYNYKGEVFCLCPISGEQRDMAYWGFEAKRERLKYRCPAAAYGLTCQGRKQCPGAQSAYGRIVRVPLKRDPRVFTPMARPSYAWKKAYKRRTAVERVNSRIDQVLGFEEHFIRGQKKMKVRLGLALMVMLAMALGWLKAGRPEMIRSLVGLKPPKKKAA